MINIFLGNDVNWQTHIFEVRDGSIEVEFLDIYRRKRGLRDKDCVFGEKFDRLNSAVGVFLSPE